MEKQATNSRSSGKKLTGLVFGILLSGLMSVFFAGLFPLLALGLTSEWLAAWGIGILIGWPLGFAVVSLVNKPVMKMAVWLTSAAPAQPSSVSRPVRWFRQISQRERSRFQ